MKDFIRIIICIMTISIILIISWPRTSEHHIDNLEKRSVFISYIELSRYFNVSSEEISKENVKKMIKKIKDMGFNEVIVQVRSFCDAIYPSNIFPWSSVLTGTEGKEYYYDLLDFFIKEAHNNGISFIAWINPYRIRTNTDISSISSKSPIYKYLNTDYIYIKNGIYLNPSKEYTNKLIIDGVLELVKNYDIDGLLFDDYFYPDNDIDINDYKKYLKSNKYISKEQYNLNVVSDLIKKVYKVCHKYNVLFGVSPDGNIENNYSKVFADVKKWCKEDGYIDFIMPQIYYGFFNESKSYKKVIDEWESFITNKNVKFRVALAFYKVGSIDKYAKKGSLEWMIHGDIIMREIILGRNINKYDGFSLFRYDFIFNNKFYNEMTMKEIENIKKILN